MKNLKIKFLLVGTMLCCLFTFPAQSQGMKDRGIDEEDIAEMVSSLITGEIENLSEYTNQAVKNAVSKSCGEKYDTLIKANYKGVVISYSNSTKYNYKLQCAAGNEVTGAEINMDRSGNYNGRRFTTERNSEGRFVIEGAGSDKRSMEGTLSSTGTLKRKLGLQNSFTAKSQITLKRLMIDENSGRVKGGSAHFDFSITGSIRKKTRSFGADITFDGKGNATASVNGQKFFINVSSGKVTPEG